jgi:hypothetical protein
MTNMLRITHFTFGLVAAVALAHGLAATAEPRETEADEIATPNHDPHRVGLMQTVTTSLGGETAEAGSLGAEIVGAHAVTLRAEPEPAEPARAFVEADTTLYARASARLRAAPNLAAGVVTKLPANTPLNAVAHSTDGVWWRVSLADGGTAYVHRDAITKNPVAEEKPPVAPAPIIEAASQQPATAHPVPARRSQSLLGLVDQTMDWLTDMAGRGSPPKVIHTER